MSTNKVYLRTVETTVSSTSSVSGEHVFDLDPGAARNNVIEYFYFIDGGGSQVDATAGSVDISMSPGADLYQTINDGTFNADQARVASRTKPNGFGKAEKVKISFTGITGDPVGFVALITQSVS